MKKDFERKTLILNYDVGFLPQPMDGEQPRNIGELWISMDSQTCRQCARCFCELAKITGEFAKITGEFWGTPKLASNFGKLAEASGTLAACLEIQLEILF